MPALQPKKNWETTGRRDTLDCLFKFESFYTKNNYALGATHEEIVTPLIKDFVSSYKNLPLCIYQFQNKFRDELRAKSGILRGREFLMKDAYSFHINQEDLDAYYLKVQQAYKNIYERVGIGDVTYMTYASGGSFSKYSHEYQTLTDSGEDLIYLDEATGLSVNKEIIDDEDIKKEFPDAKFVTKKAIEV
jgi:prolyl-tRNA synthetase